MKLKIISDGTNAGTKLIDEDTGEMVHGIQKITWEANAEEFVTKVGIEFTNIPVEITAKAEVELLDYNKDFSTLSVSKTFEKDIKIVSEASGGRSATTQSVKVTKAETSQPVSAIQHVSWEATPAGCKAKLTRIKFDKKDW